ncbi:putative transcription factor interactor and regulator CCHC(Zn) family [Rosa chinensis]|uniref:Putative transcription factor interactor and regulator CCHC(Zn) family n=1 Tax=Rosa chinensis TaxID=74649 RepID=A0A2P6RBR0_ROSCH|nr:putative transcription factor interactor and regulator CCHC(Zn) family [Rosa chinensis]
MSIPAIPYGFSALNPYTIPDNAFGMTGFLATGRGNGARFPNNMSNRFPNTGFRQGGQPVTFNPTGFGFNNNGGNNASSSNIPRGSFNNNLYTNNSLVCQLCNRVGHGARTCRSLSNFQDNASNVIGCQYCGKKNHTADRCYFIIGFPGQQQQTAEPEASAMLAAASNAPQFWLADTGATNHMTSNPQLLSNLVQYPAADAVQIGQGVGQDSVPRTE